MDTRPEDPPPAKVLRLRTEAMGGPGRKPTEARGVCLQSRWEPIFRGDGRQPTETMDVY